MPKKTRKGGKKKAGKKFRRYKKGSKKAMMYRTIAGTGSSRSGCDVCINVQRVMWSYVDHDSAYPNYPKLVQMQTTHFEPEDVERVSYGYYDTGPFISPIFRKLCTMYGEAKLKGMYISLRPKTLPEGAAFTLVGAWDRNYKIGHGPITNSMTGERAFLYLQQAAMDQGRRPFRYWGDTKVNYATHCVAHSIQEKTSWFDSEVNTTTSQSITNIWRNFGFRQIDQSGNGPNVFQPAFWFSYRLEGHDTSTPHPIPIEVSVKYYWSFRQPGMVQTPEDVQEYLLCTNAEMIWQVTGNKSVPIGGMTDVNPNLVQYVMANTKEVETVPDEAAVASADAQTIDMPKPTKIARTDTTMLGDDMAE